MRVAFNFASCRRSTSAAPSSRTKVGVCIAAEACAAPGRPVWMHCCQRVLLLLLLQQHWPTTAACGVWVARCDLCTHFRHCLLRVATIELLLRCFCGDPCRFFGPISLTLCCAVLCVCVPNYCVLTTGARPQQPCCSGRWHLWPEGAQGSLEEHGRWRGRL